MKYLRLKFPATFEVDPGKINGWTRTKYDFHLTLIEFRVAETIWESVMDYFFEITSNHPWILSLADLNFNHWDIIERPQVKLAVLTPEQQLDLIPRQTLLSAA